MKLVSIVLFSCAAMMGQGVTGALLLHPPRDTWPMYHGDSSGRRHSALLAQITPANAGETLVRDRAEGHRELLPKYSDDDIHNLFSCAAMPGQGVTGALLIHPPRDTGPMYHGDSSGRRHSALLAQIAPANAGQMTPAGALQTLMAYPQTLR